MGSISEKCKKIKIVLTDVDGVLTDGGMYYTKEGDIMKRFHTRDGMGVTLLRKRNIPTIVITKEKTPMVKQWSSKMKIKKLYDGIIEKDIICIAVILSVYSGRSKFTKEGIVNTETNDKIIQIIME